MNLHDQIVEIYPELTDDDFVPLKGVIHLMDDADGQGTYIAKWEYSKPLPKGFKLGK